MTGCLFGLRHDSATNRKCEGDHQKQRRHLHPEKLLGKRGQRGISLREIPLCSLFLSIMIGVVSLLSHEAIAHSVPVLFGRGTHREPILPFLRTGDRALTSPDSIAAESAGLRPARGA